MLTTYIFRYRNYLGRINPLADAVMLARHRVPMTK